MNWTLAVPEEKVLGQSLKLSMLASSVSAIIDLRFVNFHVSEELLRAFMSLARNSCCPLDSSSESFGAAPL